MSEVVEVVKPKTKAEIIAKMREHHSEYNLLAQELATIEAPDKKAEFEKEQRKRFENFKKELTVEATTEFKAIDWTDIESKIFDAANIDASANSEGYSLGFDREGMPGLGVSYPGGGGFTPFAYDQVDAERYVKRQRRKEKYNTKRG